MCAQMLCVGGSIHICHMLFGGMVDNGRVSLHNPDCPGTHYVEQTDVKLIGILPASSSPVLGLKVCAIVSSNLSCTYVEVRGQLVGVRSSSMWVLGSNSRLKA